jgi:succinate-acetate transporter protein
MNKKEIFWLKIFRAGSLFVFITGLSPLLAVFEATQEPWRLFFDVLSWPLDNNPASFSPGERQLSAVLGGVLCGWAILLYRLADPSLFNQRIRKILILSVWIWFVLDSAGSILSNLPLNAVSNMGFLLMLLIPLWFLRTVKEK